MSRKLAIVASIVLMLTGGLALACSVMGPLFRFRVWQLWPLTVIVAGLFFVVPPLLVRGKRGLGGLFIPGVPILANGCILFFTSVTRWWSAWEWLWPLEVLSVAVGFLSAAVYMRVIWLLIPAIIVGLNGLLFQFCAITGWWAVWAVAWVIEPLSVGLALLAVNLKRRSAGLTIAGVVMCALAGLGFMESLAIISLSQLFSVWWMWNWVAPVSLILVGFALLIWGLTRHAPASRLAVE